MENQKTKIDQIDEEIIKLLAERVKVLDAESEDKKITAPHRITS